MSSTVKLIALVVVTAAVLAVFPLLRGMDWTRAETSRINKTANGFLAPRAAGARNKATDQELRRVARKLSRQTAGGLASVALGVAKPGHKVVIVVEDDQDPRIIDAFVAAMQERGVKTDYITESQLVKEALGLTKDEAVAQGVIGASLYGSGVQDGWREAMRAPRFLPKDVMQRIRAEDESLMLGSNERGRELLRQAMGTYVNKLHPEYDHIFGGPTRDTFTKMIVGPKYKSRWLYTSWAELNAQSRLFPEDVWRNLEDQVMEIVPWIRQVRITDPEGTDITFRVTTEEAEVWAKSAYLPNHLYLYPLQGTRDLYEREGMKRTIVPAVAEGVLVGTVNHSGWVPRIKVHIKGGMVIKIEGGGRFGELWALMLENEELKQAHYPTMPRPGFFYLYESSLGVNPKQVGNPAKVTDGNGRSGVLHWGFGVESTIPEMLEYARQHNLPKDHGFHVQTYFSTYEVTLRSGQKVKVVDNGHLTALDDSEAKALASRYGDPGELLFEDWIPGIPGINMPGDYERDYASDPLGFYQRLVSEQQDERTSGGGN